MKKSGLSIHCHHDKLIEHCYNYKERVNAIKDTKPQNEQEIRLRLFKILPDKALKDIPKELQKANAKLAKADTELAKANAKLANKAGAKPYAEWKKANTELIMAHTEWKKKDQEVFHNKWCGCEYWKNGEIIFNNKKE